MHVSEQASDWVNDGMKRWMGMGAQINFLSHNPHMQIPSILTSGQNEIAVVAATFHREEPSGTKTALNPDNFTTMLDGRPAFLIYPLVNCRRLKLPGNYPEKKFRYNSKGINYNDGWGNPNPKRKTRECFFIENDIFNHSKQHRISCVFSLHEDSEHPGVGYIYTQNIDRPTRTTIANRIKVTDIASYLASFPQTTSHSITYGGVIEEGFIIADPKDDYSFEDWSAKIFKTPSVLIEAPFGLDLEIRERFHATVLKAVVESVI